MASKLKKIELIDDDKFNMPILVNCGHIEIGHIHRKSDWHTHKAYSKLADEYKWFRNIDNSVDFIVNKAQQFINDITE